MNGGSDGGPLLHLTTAAPWRVALSAGTVVPPSLVTDGFVHLSRPDQVALPANRLFAGRDDLLLLVVDPDRLTDEVRWEPGVPTDPASMRFPHLYGPLPVRAVTSAVPYRPGSDGAFAEPEGIPSPADHAARARAFDRSLALRRAAVVVPVVGGFGVVDPRVHHSYQHNTLWFDDEVDATTIEAGADRVLAGYGHRRAELDHAPPADLGWDVQELRILVLDLVPDRRPDLVLDVGVQVGVEVVTATHEVMAGLWAPTWRRDLPDVDDEAVEHLVRREAFADAHVRLVDLAVLGDDGVPVAGTQVRIDGATAAIDAVMTAPAARGRGCGNALVRDAVRRARAAGCDLVFLLAAADDWPLAWYQRLGFVEVGVRWEVTKVLGG